MATKRGSTAMSKEHKLALERGRAEGRSVRLYLEALRNNRPQRGRKRTPQSIERRLARIEADLAAAGAISRLALVQERRDLADELQSMKTGDNFAELEDGFVAVAKSYGDRKGISYESWREVGVPAAVLKRAGIERTRGKN